MLAQPFDGEFVTQFPQANQRFVGISIGLLIPNLASVEEALYQPEYLGCCIWKLHNMLYCRLSDVSLEIFLIELGAVAEKVFLNAERLLIGTYKDNDEYGMRLACILLVFE